MRTGQQRESVEESQDLSQETTAEPHEQHEPEMYRAFEMRSLETQARRVVGNARQPFRAARQ